MSIVETAPPAQVGYAQEAMQQLREAIQHLPSEEKNRHFICLLEFRPHFTFWLLSDSLSFQFVVHYTRFLLTFPVLGVHYLVVW